MSARILVIEDNHDNRELMTYLLRSAGHTVLVTEDGTSGVAAARAERPDLILLDLHMPGISGWEAAEAIRAEPALRRVPIVAVTALAMVGDRDAVLASGFDGYIAKPLTPETFAAEAVGFLPEPLEPAAAGEGGRA